MNRENTLSNKNLYSYSNIKNILKYNTNNGCISSNNLTTNRTEFDKLMNIKFGLTKLLSLNIYTL